MVERFENTKLRDTMCLYVATQTKYSNAWNAACKKYKTLRTVRSKTEEEFKNMIKAHNVVAEALKDEEGARD